MVAQLQTSRPTRWYINGPGIQQAKQTVQGTAQISNGTANQTIDFCIVAGSSIRERLESLVTEKFGSEWALGSCQTDGVF